MASAPAGTGTDAVALAWLRDRQAPLRGWITLASAAGIGAHLAFALFAFALARTFGAWLASSPGAASAFWLALMPAALLLRSVLAALRDWAGLRAGIALRQRARSEVLDALERLGPLRAGAGPDGALATLVIEQVDALGDYAGRYLPQRTIAAGVPILLVALVLPHSWLAALLLLATAPPVPLFMGLIGRGAATASLKQAQALAILGGRFLDLVRGLPTLRLLGRAADGGAWLAADAAQYRERTMGVLRLAFLSSAVLELFASVAIALVALYLGLALLGRFDIGHYGHPMTLGRALFILLLAPEFFAPLRQLGVDYHVRAAALAAAGQVATLLAAMPEPRNVEAASRMPPETPQAAAFIEFERVALRHADGRVALRDVSFRIEAGERIELRGASGSGKSTVLALLAGFVEPSEGVVRIDGAPLAALDRAAWWRRLGWLEQRPEWFRMSIRENVLLGLGPEAEPRLRPALEAAGLADTVCALPQGVAAVPGEDGTLSGGQMQRLALARALARKADVWLFDEPLAQLDPDTSAQLRVTLADASAGCTVLMASHEEHSPEWIGRRLTLEHGRLVSDERRDAECVFR